MMCPSSTFRSFIDLYASRVQIDRARTLTYRGTGDRSPRESVVWRLRTHVKEDAGSVVDLLIHSCSRGHSSRLKVNAEDGTRSEE